MFAIKQLCDSLSIILKHFVSIIQKLYTKLSKFKEKLAWNKKKIFASISVATFLSVYEKLE